MEGGFKGMYYIMVKIVHVGNNLLKLCPTIVSLLMSELS